MALALRLMGPANVGRLMVAEARLPICGLTSNEEKPGAVGWMPGGRRVDRRGGQNGDEMHQLCHMTMPHSLTHQPSSNCIDETRRPGVGPGCIGVEYNVTNIKTIHNGSKNQVLWNGSDQDRFGFSSVVHASMVAVAPSCSMLHQLFLAQLVMAFRPACPVSS